MIPLIRRCFCQRLEPPRRDGGLKRRGAFCERLVAALAYARRRLEPLGVFIPPGASRAARGSAGVGGGWGAFATICRRLSPFVVPYTPNAAPPSPRGHAIGPPPTPHPRRDLFLCHELFSDAPQALKIASPIVNYLISSDINIGVCCCCIMDAVFGV